MVRTIPRRAVIGTYQRNCAVCGMPFLRSKMFKRKDGKVVCRWDNFNKPVQITPKSEKPFIRD
jgi:uncharacterized Zn finger protein (UPF0148 family)